MLPARHRLRSAEGFRGAVRRGRRAGGALLVVHLESGYVDKEISRQTLVGFVVAKAVGPAVVRNRVKRRLRHLMGERLAQLPTGSVVVIRALPDSSTADSRELGSELDRCLDRVTGVPV